MKKAISLILTLVMIMSLTIPAYANDLAIGDMEAKIQREIEVAEEHVWEDLYNQLAAQDALDGMEYFKDALRPEIESAVRAKYSNVSLSSVSTTLQYNFPNGGMVCYDGALNTKNIEVFMTREQTLKYYWETTGVALSDYVEFVLGLIPGTQLLALAAAGNIILRDIAHNNLEETNLFARLLHISWGAGAEQATYAYGWDTYPYGYVHVDHGVKPEVYYGI